MSLQVHVISIPGVSHGWIYNPNNVVTQIREFCASNNCEVIEIKTLDGLDKIIRNPPERLILINAHGETIPIPKSWENWRPYLHTISNNIIEKGWIVVSITGMPFWYYSSDENDIEIQWNGINELLSSIEIEVLRNLMYGWTEITKFGKNISRIFDVPLVDSLLFSRLLKFTNLTNITKSMYRIGDLSGISAIKMGNGYFIHNGLMATNITTQKDGKPSNITDDFLALLSIVFTIGVIKSEESAIELFERYKDNENLLRENIVIPLLRLKGFKNVSDVHGSDEHGRDIVCYLNDYFKNRINFGFQVKARRIHAYSSRPNKHNITVIVTQIKEAFRIPFFDTLANENKMIHQLYIITSKIITAEAKRSIVAGSYQNKRYTHFIDGGQLKEEWINNYIL